MENKKSSQNLSKVTATSSNGNTPSEQSSRSGKDTGAAIVSILYLLFTLGFFSWFLFDVWIDSHFLARLVGYDLTRLQTPYFHMIAYTVIGGAIGGIVNGIRSFLNYYKDFDRVYFWKYITAPWMGAALAIIGFALLQSTVAIFGGAATNAGTASPQFLANFAVGALAGYGSRDVFVWLDRQASKLFSAEEVPSVTGKEETVAKEQVQATNLPLGTTVTVPAKNTEEEGKVVDQNPAAGTVVDSNQPVNLVVAKSPNGETTETESNDGSENKSDNTAG
jgi:hypothetical protein